VATAEDKKVSADVASYWHSRKDLLYYEVVRIIVQRISRGASTMIDVGSGGCPYLDWFTHVKTRVSLDLDNPYSGDGILPIRTDFLSWTPDQQYDVVLCLQVLEHILDARAFAQHLLNSGKVIVATVPYKWPENHSKLHVHDPVDEEKLLACFGREPNFTYICREVIAPVKRIINVYDCFGSKWSGTNHRERILNAIKVAE